ncbi:MAG: corrinoid activation/regeneration protein AcsV [Clostridia bacterium]
MYSVTYKNEGGGETTIFAALGENLLELSKKANVAIDAPCSGNGSCGKCRIKLLSGTVDSEQTRHLSDNEYADGWRLACLTKVTDNVTVLVPDISSAYKSRMKVADLSSGAEILIFDRLRAELRQAGLCFSSAITMLSLTLDKPTLSDTMPDNERICRALERALSVHTILLPYSVLQKLPDVLRASDFSVRCVIEKNETGATLLDLLHMDDRIPVCGLAIDIGTTSVTGILVNLQTGEILSKASAGNGQIRYGADVINRIVEQQKNGGKDHLQTAIIEETLLPMLKNLYQAANVPSDHVYHGCIAGNTTMEHLLLGINANPLRIEPYIPTFFACAPISAQVLRLPASEAATITLAPNIGSYVGGDITAGTLASLIWHRQELSLFIDLGTNGELVFGNKEFLMSCACSAGPAFEGGDISCGMRATDGAIEALQIDAVSMEPTLSVIGGGRPIGLCGSGIIDCIAELFTAGIINARGQFVREGARIMIDEHGSACYVVANRDCTGSPRAVTITEVDIDNFIRAKGAIFSAIQTMLNSLDMDVSVIDRVYVAGGIGSGINMENAVRIGMFPDIAREKFHYIGNSSLIGAYAMLMSMDARQKLSEVARSMTYLELSTEPHYMDAFVAACFLPHTDMHLFPSVKGVER